MNAIRTVFSSVAAFSDTVKNQYSSMLDLANDIYGRVNGMLAFLDEEKSKIEKQLIRIERVEMTVGEKVREYAVSMESAYSDYQYYSDAFYRADDECEEDHYRELKECAYNEYENARSCHIEAKGVLAKVEDEAAKIRQLAAAINTVKAALERNSFEIRKYISLAGEEASYNVQALFALLRSIENYVTSREIFSTYEINRVRDSGFSSVSGSSGVKRGSVGGADRSATVGYVRRYVVRSAETMEQYLTRDGRQKPLYRRFNVYSQPVKDMILQSTARMGPAFQQFILKQLDGVIFLNARHGFTYGVNGKNGKTLRIIGVNLTDPAFQRNLLLHIGHHIYLTGRTRETVTMNNIAAAEAENNIYHANVHIKNLSRRIKAKSATVEAGKANRPTAGSRFFSTCFREYVNRNIEFLNEVKESYKESYKLFCDMIQKMPCN